MPRHKGEGVGKHHELHPVWVHLVDLEADGVHVHPLSFGRKKTWQGGYLSWLRRLVLSSDHRNIHLPLSARSSRKGGFSCHGRRGLHRVVHFHGSFQAQSLKHRPRCGRDGRELVDGIPSQLQSLHARCQVSHLLDASLINSPRVGLLHRHELLSSAKLLPAPGGHLIVVEFLLL